MKWKLQTLDWYLIKKFLGTFFFTLAIFLAIAVVFDYSEKVDDFISKRNSFLIKLIKSPPFQFLGRFFLNRRLMQLPL